MYLDSLNQMIYFLDYSTVSIYLDLVSLLIYFDDNSSIPFIRSNSTGEKTNAITNLKWTTRCSILSPFIDSSLDSKFGK